MAEEVKKGKVLKVLTADSKGNVNTEYSQQLPDDPFGNAYKHAGIQEPPYSLEQLMFLAEQHPTHAAAIEQKAADVVGTGWDWEQRDPEGEDKGGDAEKKKLDEWFKSLADDAAKDDTTHEILLATWDDVETFGQGFIELARDKGKDRKIRHWYRTPAHTFRFHRDGVRIMQIRGEKRRWFKRWIPGDKRVVDASTGKVVEDIGEVKNPANELFVLKRPTRRSTWYGIPKYISATGWITLSTAARDDNVLFFENRREPRWVIILENVEDDPDLETMLADALRNDAKEPHKNLILPLTGPAKATFQKLGTDGSDASWDKLQDRVDSAVLLAHRMPGERIGVVRAGPLGGNAVTSATRVYKEGFVQTSQQILATRINRLIRYEGPDGASQDEPAEPKYLWTPNELDLTEQKEDQENAKGGFQGGVLKLNEARKRYGEEPLEDGDERGDKFYWELAKGGQPGGLPPDSAQLAEQQTALADRIEGLIGGSGGGGG